MQVTINVSDIMRVEVRGIEVALDLTKAKNDETRIAIVERLAAYGMRKFNDAAPMGLKAPVGNEEAMAKFRKDCAGNARSIIERWLIGDFEADRSREPSDPVEARIRLIAGGQANAKLGKLGAKATDAEKAAWTKLRDERMAVPAVRAAAERQIAEEAELAAGL